MSQTILYDPTKHPEWTPPHSKLWYDQMALDCGEYEYPWKSTFEESTAETLFGKMVSERLDERSRVLDAGCGHGGFLTRWALHAQEAIGIDMQPMFIETAKRRNKSDTTRFLTVDVDHGLPFADDSFDMVYSKKGPWLFKKAQDEGFRIIKSGGHVLHMIHGFTDGGLRTLFPGLYVPLPWDKAKAIERVREDFHLSDSPLTDIDIQVVEEAEYLSTPEDVLLKKCFGQNQKLKDYVWHACLEEVAEIFNKHAAPEGLRVVNYYFLISAVAKKINVHNSNYD